MASILESVVDLYTDGACRGNPGIGGWGVVIRNGIEVKELFGMEEDTTNNRMELLAAIRGLEALPDSSQVNLYTDSQYVRNGITEWIFVWRKRDWKTAAGKVVKNQELWVNLDKIRCAHRVEWHWVKGHAGDPDNERADALANYAIDRFLTGREKE